MMDFENQNDKAWSKILTRRSSVGCSSRLSYYRNGEGIPFKWEMEPGIAKEPHREEIPPLTPPPALISVGLPKPCIPDPKPSTRSKLRYWKKRVVKLGKSKNKKPQDCFDEDVIGNFDMLSRLDCSSDSESMASPRGSSFSSSSSLSFFKGRPSLHSQSSQSSIRDVYGRPLTFGCFPMHVSRVLVSIARR